MDTASPAPQDADALHEPQDDPTDRSSPADAGQTTAEYALVLLGAAAIAAILIKWATSPSGLMKLFTAILRKLIQGVAG